jgi:hypothetical protein
MKNEKATELNDLDLAQIAAGMEKVKKLEPKNTGFNPNGGKPRT